MTHDRYELDIERSTLPVGVSEVCEAFTAALDILNERFRVDLDDLALPSNQHPELGMEPLPHFVDVLGLVDALDVRPFDDPPNLVSVIHRCVLLVGDVQAGPDALAAGKHRSGNGSWGLEKKKGQPRLRSVLCLVRDT